MKNWPLLCPMLVVHVLHQHRQGRRLFPTIATRESQHFMKTTCQTRHLQGNHHQVVSHFHSLVKFFLEHLQLKQRDPKRSRDGGPLQNLQRGASSMVVDGASPNAPSSSICHQIFNNIICILNLHLHVLPTY